MAALLKQQKAITSAGMGTASDGYVNTLTITPTAALAVGSVLWLSVNLNGTNAALSTAPAATGLTFTKWTAASISGTPTGSDQAIETWMAVVGTAGTPVITMTATNGVLWAVNLREYSGIATTSYQVAAGTSADGTTSGDGYVTSHPVVTTGAGAVGGDMVVSGINVAAPNEVFTGGNGYTNLTQMKAITGLAYLSAAVQDRIATAPGTQSASFGTAGYRKGVSVIAVLKAAVTSAPPAPTDLTASPGATSVALSWSPASTATSYTVRRGTAAAGPFTVVSSTVTSTSYADTGLTTGVTYYYTVSATNTVGSSAQTAFPAAKTAPAPAVVFADWYANGSKPNLNTASMRQTFRSKVTAWFSFTLTAETTPGTPIPQNARLPGAIRRIKAPDQPFYSSWDPNWPNKRNGTVSEGMGYGMLFCAWLSNPALETGVYWSEAKATLDSLYRFYDSHKNDKGLMDWHIYDTNVAGDFNGATDGDEDVAEALRVMSELFGDAGPINYGAEADKLMKAIEDYEFVPQTGYAKPNLMLNGDNWGVNTDSYMPDYSRMGYWREWSKWLRKRGRTVRADRWLQILQVNYDHIDFYASAAGNAWSAGVPDRQTRSYGTIEGDFNNKVSYNSIRLGFGWMLDYLWHGSEADPRAKSYMDRIANRFKAVFTTGANVKAPAYPGDLSSSEGYTNLAGYAYVGSVSLGLAANQTFATELFNAVAAANDYSSSYFNGGLGCYTLGVMSGAAQPFTTTTAVVDPGTGTETGGGGGTTTPDPVSTKGYFSYWNGTQWVQFTPAAATA